MAVERNVDINVNVKGAGAAKSKLGGVSSATGKLDGQSQGLVGSLLNMSGGLKGVGMAAAGAGGALIALKVVQQVAEWFKIATKAAIDFTKSAVKVADSFDVMEKRLKALTGSEKEAAAAMTQIKEFAAGTTAQVSELTEAYIAMKPVFGDISNELLMDVSNAAAGAGRSIETIADTFIRLKTGDFGVEQLRKLNIVKADLEDFDVKFDASGKLISSTDEAMAGVSAIIRDRYGSMQEEMATTLTGAISNLQDAWDNLLADAGEKLLPVLNKIVRKVTEMVEKIVQAGTLKDAIGALADAFEENEEFIDEIIESLPELAKGLGELIVAGGEFISVLSDINELWAEIGTTGNTVMEDLTTAFKLLTYAMAGSMAMFEVILDKGIRTTADDLDKALSEVEQRMNIMGAGLVKEKTGAELKSASEYGDAPSDIKDMIADYRAADYDDETIAFMAPKARPYLNIEDKKPRGKPGKGKDRVPFGTVTLEERLRASQASLEAEGGIVTPEERAKEDYDAYVRAMESAAGAAITETEKDVEETQAERKARLKSQLETIAKVIDPTQYIIEGLKSGDMKKAMQDWAIQLGTYAATELLSSLIMSGLLAILNMITGGGAGIVGAIAQGAGQAQHGMYTGGYEGPVWVHPGEVIAPLDTLPAMTNLINRAMLGTNLPTPSGVTGGGGVSINVDSKASDLVDIYRAESVDRGEVALDYLRGESS